MWGSMHRSSQVTCGVRRLWSSACLRRPHGPPTPVQVTGGYSVLEAVTARYTGQRGEMGEVRESSRGRRALQLMRVNIT